MTMTNLERERLTNLSSEQAGLTKEVEHMNKSLERVHERITEMHEYLKGMTKDVSGILRQNERHEERLAQLQNITASLGETVVQIDKSGKRLRHVLFAFWGLLVAMAVLVGILGEEVLPKALSWLWALVGL